MLNRIVRRAACAGLVCASLGLTTGTAMVGGCSSGGGLGGLMNKSAMDMLTPMVKDAANSYLANLTSLTSSLANIKDVQDVMAFVKEAEPKIKEVSSAYKTLSTTTGDERSNLMKAFGPKIESANSGFLGQSERVKGSGVWAQLAGPALDKVSLFK